MAFEALEYPPDPCVLDLFITYDYVYVSTKDDLS